MRDIAIGIVRRASIFLFCVAHSFFISQVALAHGGVGMVEGQCLIRIGNLEARFTGYQPASRGSEEFCDDMPDLTNSIFVLNFIHDVLKTMPLDFRIIRDEKDFGLSATADDVESLGDLGSVTEYYQSPIQYSDGIVKFQHEFIKAGNYIGIITVQHLYQTPSPASSKSQFQNKKIKAVFPFRIGAVNYSDYWPVFILILVMLQIMFRMHSRRINNVLEK
ncbi:MAG: hypothetical protein KUG82_04655 [Pseudomonadales bacterium]|nr:hypothetical protein [Pseudomonadales bacterium]